MTTWIGFADSGRKTCFFILLLNENKVGNKDYVGGCARNGKGGIIWLTAGLFELRHINRGFEREAPLPIGLGEEDEKYSLRSVENRKSGE